MCGDAAATLPVAAQLESQRATLQAEGENEGAAFLAVLLSMLDRIVPKAADQLAGQYLRAFNRLLNQVHTLLGVTYFKGTPSAASMADRCQQLHCMRHPPLLVSVAASQSC